MSSENVCSDETAAAFVFDLRDEAGFLLVNQIAEPLFETSAGDDSLDPEAIALLHSLKTHADDHIVCELIDLFVADAADRHIQMTLALNAGNAQGLGKAAHALKSGAYTLGATALAAVCQQIEEFARDGMVAECGPLVGDVQSHLMRLHPLLEAERARG